MSGVQHFVGRQEELDSIHKKLQYDGTRKTVLVHGLGGIGKTQLALAYERHHRGQYSAVFWMNSKDVETLKQSYAAAARRIYDEHPSLVHFKTVVESKDLDDAIEAVKKWLSHAQNKQWLLICDNYDTPKLPGRNDPGTFDIWRFLPVADHGAVLITTRSSQFAIGRGVPVKKLESVEESLAILSHASGRAGLESGRF